MIQCTPRSTLFPYTTLFRSVGELLEAPERVEEVGRAAAHEVGAARAADEQHVAGEEVTVDDESERVGCVTGDRKSTRLNSSHPSTSYAVFCLKKKKITNF